MTVHSDAASQIHAKHPFCLSYSSCTLANATHAPHIGRAPIYISVGVMLSSGDPCSQVAYVIVRTSNVGTTRPPAIEGVCLYRLRFVDHGSAALVAKRSEQAAKYPATSREQSLCSRKKGALAGRRLETRFLPCLGRAVCFAVEEAHGSRVWATAVFRPAGVASLVSRCFLYLCCMSFLLARCVLSQQRESPVGLVASFANYLI